MRQPLLPDQELGELGTAELAKEEPVLEEALREVRWQQALLIEVHAGKGPRVRWLG